MKKTGFIDDSIAETISFKYINGCSKKTYSAHKTDWRVFPYTVIVCAFDSEYICETKTEGVYKIHDKEAVVVPGNTQHRMIFNRSGYLSYIHISYTIFNSIDVLSFFDIPGIIPYRKENPVCELIDKLHFYRNSGQNVFPIKNMIRFKELGFSLLNNILDSSVEKENISFFISKIHSMLPVLNYMQENLEKKISRRTLAEILSLSETRFHYAFKEIMKIAPMMYLRNIRMQKAHILLTTSSLPIYEIAASVGYADCFNFSKQFKKHFGESPSEVRRKAGSSEND